MIPILILAAGGSTRMRGQDKLLQDVGGQPLLRLQCQRALATGHPVFVALPTPDHPRQKAIADLPLQVLIVPDAAEGMSGTLRGAVAQLPDAPAFMLLLGDLIDIQTSDLQALLKARDMHPDYLIWRGATQDGKPGHPIIFDGALRVEFTLLAGDGGGEALVNPRRVQTHLTRLAGRRARHDLDTPDAWDAWRKSAR